MKSDNLSNKKIIYKRLLSGSVFSLLFLICGAPVFGQTEVAFRNGENYKIGAGDVLTVRVTKNDMLSLDGVRVNNNGTIRLPMIDSDIQVSCRTEVQLAGIITEKYKKYLLNPQVYVAVKEFHANTVAVVGAVIAPGRFQIQRPTRLLELMTFVNGATPAAGQHIQIIRSLNAPDCEQNPAIQPPQSNQEQMIITLPLSETLRGNEAANPFVQPGDVIRITEAEQAFIIGNVRSAATINLKEPITLTKAIAMAGGLAPDAQSDKIKILRQERGSLNKTELVVNFKDISKQKQPDVLLQANDIVDIPGPSGTRKFLKDIFQTAVPNMMRVPMIIP